MGCCLSSRSSGLSSGCCISVGARTEKVLSHRCRSVGHQQPRTSTRQSEEKVINSNCHYHIAKSVSTSNDTDWLRTSLDRIDMVRTRTRPTTRGLSGKSPKLCAPNAFLRVLYDHSMSARAAGGNFMMARRWYCCSGGGDDDRLIEELWKLLAGWWCFLKCFHLRPTDTD